MQFLDVFKGRYQLLLLYCYRKNAPWICVQNPSAKELHSDYEKAFQLWEELKSSQIRITAERVKGMHRL